MAAVKQLLLIVALLLASASSYALDLYFYSSVYGTPEGVNPEFGIALECKSAAGLEVVASNGAQLRAPLREAVLFTDISLGSRCRYQHIVPRVPTLDSGRGAQFRPAAGLWTEFIAEPSYGVNSYLSIPVVQHYYKTRDYSVSGGLFSVAESLPLIRVNVQVICTTPAFEFPLLPSVPSVSVEFSRVYSLPFYEILHDVPVGATCTFNVDRDAVVSQLGNTGFALGLIDSYYGFLTVAIHPKTFALSSAEILVTSNAISPAATADVTVSCDLGLGIANYQKTFPATLLGTTIRLNDVPQPSRCSLSALTYAIAPEGFVYVKNTFASFTPKVLTTPVQIALSIEALPARRVLILSATQGGPPDGMQFFLSVRCKFTHDKAGELEFSTYISGATSGPLRSDPSIPIGAQCESSRVRYESVPVGYVPLFPAFQNQTFAFGVNAADVLPKFTVTANDPLQFALTHRLAKADAQIRIRWEALPGSANVAYDPKVYAGAECRTLQLLPDNFMTTYRQIYPNGNKTDSVLDGAVIGESCETTVYGTSLPPGYAWAPRSHKFEVPITRGLEEITVRSLLYSYAAATIEFRVVGRDIPIRYAGSAEFRCEKFNQIIFSTNVSFYEDRLVGNLETVPHDARCSVLNLQISNSGQNLIIENPVAVFVTPTSGAYWNMLFNIETAQFGAESSARAVPTLSNLGTALLISLLALLFSKRALVSRLRLKQPTFERAPKSGSEEA